MSGAMREKNSSDYDLERLTELFDTALTSDDPRVKNALRQLMMMVILTSADHEDQDKIRGRQGPMRRMAEDIRDLHRSVESLRQELHHLQKQTAWSGGYRTAENTAGMKAQSATDAVSARDYWAQRGPSVPMNQIDSRSLDSHISDDDLRGLNISIAPATKGLFK
jgi:DNA repair ATPase RecN